MIFRRLVQTTAVLAALSTALPALALEAAPARMEKTDPPAPVSVAPTITVPTGITVEPGDFVQIKPVTTGKNIKWRVGRSAVRGLTVFPSELLKDPTVFVAIAKARGDGAQATYSIYFWTSLNDELSDIAECQVTVTGTVVPPTPPTPPTPPVPPAPLTGKRVLMIYDSPNSEKMPEKQQQVLYSTGIRNYLLSHCDKDGSTAAFRIWDKDVDTSGESKVWQDAMKRPRSQVPWIIISNGTTGYEGPLPATMDEANALFKKYLE